ncbi:transglycosylase domain-containing protein [Nostocoides australiense]
MPTPRTSTPATTTKPKKKRRWLRRTLWTLFTLGLLGAIGLVIAYIVTPIPKPNEAALQQSSTIYYSDGKTVMDRFAEVNRSIVPIDRIPKEVQEAFLAAEDRSFYDNNGISPKGIARSIWVGLRGGPQQGGSTITQQYVKNYYLTQDRTLTRKFKEIMISVKIDGELSKDDILANYLNTIYFGRGASGIQTASQAYFGKSVNQLTVSEGALLASVIRGPSYYDPRLGAEQKQNAKERWGYVLDGMVDQGWLTQAERDKAKFPATIKIRTNRIATGPEGFLSEMVRAELQSKVGLTEDDLARGGYRITTTIDKRAQEAAKSAIAARMPQGVNDLHVGLAAVAPGDGAIRALYGGAKYGSGDLGYFNTATQAAMQAGSTYKVWTLVAALERGIPLSTRFDARSPMFFEQFKSTEPGATPAAAAGEVVNFGNHGYGVVDMATATGLSANTYYAQLNIEVGPESTRDAAETAGLKAAGAQKELGDNYANVFGTDLVSVLGQANAYATIAAEGRRATPYIISGVRATGQFKINYKADKQVKTVFDKAVMRDTIHAMARVTQAGGTGAAAAALGRPAAGKTGTTSDNYSAWFDGFTPGQLAAAVGIYKGDGSLVPENQMNAIPGVGELTGGTVPVNIWTDFMRLALEGQPIAPLPPAGNVSGGSPTSVTTAPTTQSSTTTQSSSSSSSSSSSESVTQTETTTTESSTPPPTTDTSTTAPPTTDTGTSPPPTDPGTTTPPTDPGTKTPPTQETGLPTSSSSGPIRPTDTTSAP